jgi:hypothetical protein
MNFRKFLVPIGIVVLVFASYRAYSWQGIFAVAGGLMMWALLHYTRFMNVMTKAARQPMGYVGSAVMLNAKLKPGVNLLHVTAMTRSLGELRSKEGEQPEFYRWKDGTESHVTCEFVHGKLVRWELVRPVAAPAPPVVDASSAPAPSES